MIRRSQVNFLLDIHMPIALHLFLQTILPKIRVCSCLVFLIFNNCVFVRLYNLGNCNPRLMRSTLYMAPASNDLLKASQIPFAVACSPFAAFQEQEQQLPIIDLGPGGPVRCQRCKAYMCPFMEFQDVRFTFLNHFVLYVVFYYFREVGAPESAIRIGLATFDHAVHFFDLSSTQPSMMVIGDVSDMFVPIVDGLLLPYSQAVMGIRAVLAEIPHLFEHSKVTETMLGPVVQAGLDALQCADRAGKLFIFSTLLPTYDAPGKLKAKNDRNLLGTEKEKVIVCYYCKRSALVPQSDFYTKLGELCVKNAVTVDLFLFPNAFIDIATISQLSAVTGGSVYKYQYFMAEKDANRFLYDLEHNVSRQIAFDCMVRVRSSAGIRPVTFHGSFFMENSTDLEMSSIDEDKVYFIIAINFSLLLFALYYLQAFFVELKHDDKLSDPSAIIQCAVLFTSVSGQRRLRIINLCLPVSSDYNQLYRVADQGALTTLLLKIGIFFLLFMIENYLLYQFFSCMSLLFLI
uniref:Protein transport protein Sec24D n=1 Tax=Heterorhabditis bacteriophora TaxID=37862 RepID=A0A1I7XDB0_HETBA